MRRVIVIATRQIGDVLLTTALIRLTRERWPDARIDVLGIRGTLGILAGNDDIDLRIEIPGHLGLCASWPVIRQLWRRYDLALITQPSDRAHLLGFIAAPLRSGLIPAANRSNWWKRRLLFHGVDCAGDLGTTHVVAEKLGLLAPWMPVAQPLPKVIPPKGLPLPKEVALQDGYVVVHAPSMWNYKQWPTASYADVITGLLSRGRQVVLTGSGGPRDKACIGPLAMLGQPPQLMDLSGLLDFQQLRTLLGGAALYIGPDTSVSHLAAASGAPTLAIFGPTNPLRWGPWPAKASAGELFKRSALRQTSGNVTLLQGPQACVPCGRAGCENHHDSRSDCLTAITPGQVLAAADRLLQGQE